MASKLILDVLVNVKGAKDLDTVSGKLSQTGRTLTRNVTLPLLAVGAASIKLGADAQTADAQLQAAFKSMRAGAFTTIPALEEQATALAKATSFDDEAIKRAQALMLTFGKVTGDSFTRATNLATDMASAFGTDLQPQVIRLGKALNDPIKGLTLLNRVGISFTEEQKAQITAMVEAGDTAGAQALILGELEKRFGGVAAAIGSTDAGQFAQAMEELGEAGESVGVILLPVVANIAGVLRTLAEGFQALPGPVQGFVVAALTFAAAVGPLILIGTKLAGGLGLLRIAILNIPTALGFLDLAFSKIGLAFNALKLLFLANPWILLAAAVIAIAALIILNWDKIWGFLQAVWKKITDAVGALANALSGAWDTITSVAQTAWTFLVNIIRGSINGLIDILNGFLGFLNGLSFGAGPWDVGPIHVDAIAIDPFNIPLIPHLAEGGIIRSPTLALLGESGAEAVVPLGKEVGSTHFHSHIEVKGEDPFIRNEADLIRTNQRIAFLEGF